MQVTHVKRSNLTQGPEGNMILMRAWKLRICKTIGNSGACAYTPPQEFNQEDS